MVAGAETRKSYVMPNEEQAATPQEVMGTCLRLELEAAALYRRFHRATADTRLRALWDGMSHEETEHARKVDQLAGRAGLCVPAISRPRLAALAGRVEAVRRHAEAGDLSDARMLAITAALEFSEMDDLFDAICRQGGVSLDAGRAEHLAPLVAAVAGRESDGDVLRPLLAALVRLRRRAGSTAALGDVSGET
jgi:hypothetical protein